MQAGTLLEQTADMALFALGWAHLTPAVRGEAGAVKTMACQKLLVCYSSSDT